MNKHMYITSAPINASTAQSSAITALKKAQSTVDILYPIVTSVQLTVISSMQFKRATQYRKFPNTISAPSEIDQLSPADLRLFQSHCKDLLKTLYGIDSDICPLLQAELNLHQAKVRFLNSLQPITGKSAREIMRKGQEQSNKIVSNWLNNFNK